mgnify:CR=1 FL=1
MSDRFDYINIRYCYFSLGIAIYIAFIFSNAMRNKVKLLSLLLERVEVRGIEPKLYLFPHILPSPSGEGFNICVATSSMMEKVENRAS